MSALLILIAFLPMGIAAHQFWSAIEQVKPTLPIQFRDNRLARIAIDTHVWNSSVPASARWRYLRSLLGMSLGFGLIALAELVAGQLVPTLLFAGLFLLALVQFLRRRIKYSALL
ncbi:hypothetical protein [Bradyrhizobium prioriisuperbiae]|uniref:hypothetical protein n=1 Tax=Bradyrhizobium prioriisuperbiae TaxID=2854389 RepID=UPI0028EE59F6|nr:hypothetical protein [Bradyrhizobium prioritasuperba]